MVVQRKKQGILIRDHFRSKCALGVPSHEAIIGQFDDDNDVRKVIDDAMKVDLVRGIEFIEHAGLEYPIVVGEFYGGCEGLFVVFVADEDVVLEKLVVSHLLELLLLDVVGLSALLDFSLEGLQDQIVLFLYLLQGSFVLFFQLQSHCSCLFFRIMSFLFHLFVLFMLCCQLSLVSIYLSCLFGIQLCYLFLIFLSQPDLRHPLLSFLLVDLIFDIFSAAFQVLDLQLILHHSPCQLISFLLLFLVLCFEMFQLFFISLPFFFDQSCHLLLQSFFITQFFIFKLLLPLFRSLYGCSFSSFRPFVHYLWFLISSCLFIITFAARHASHNNKKYNHSLNYLIYLSCEFHHFCVLFLRTSKIQPPFSNPHFQHESLFLHSYYVLV